MTFSASPAPETFTPSSNSVLGKARKHTWFGLLGGIAIVFAISGFRWFVLIFALLIGGLMDWIIRYHLNATRGAVTLDASGLKAECLSGPTKQFAWSELGEVTVESVESTRVLKFQLTPSAERPAGRSFWTGANATQPTLNLGPFVAADQERLLDAIHRWQALARGEVGAASATTNELVAEREFQEQLTALAPQTWATWALIAINVWVWLFALSKGGDLAAEISESRLRPYQWDIHAIFPEEWYREKYRLYVPS